MSEQGEQTDRRVTKIRRINVTFYETEYDSLIRESGELGINLAELIRQGIRLRSKVRDLSANNIVLATQDPRGQLVKISPISILL